jgi:hypothetical protein
MLSARHALGLLTSNEIARVADDLLACGMYAPSLGGLADTRYPVMSEVGPLFLASLRELGVPLPAAEEAIRTVAWYALADLAEGRGCPRACLRRLLDQLPQPHEAYARRVLEPWGGQDLASWASYLEALADEGFIDNKVLVRRQVDFDEEIAAFAARFVRGYCPVPVDPAWLSWGGGTVPRLARSIRDEGRFIDLPVLADALEEADCQDNEVLAHCRGAARHTGFCWLIDRLLAEG